MDDAIIFVLKSNLILTYKTDMNLINDLFFEMHYLLQRPKQVNNIRQQIMNQYHVSTTSMTTDVLLYLASFIYRFTLFDERIDRKSF